MLLLLFLYLVSIIFMTWYLNINKISVFSYPVFMHFFAIILELPAAIYSYSQFDANSGIYNSYELNESTYGLLFIFYLVFIMSQVFFTIEGLKVSKIKLPRYIPYADGRAPTYRIIFFVFFLSSLLLSLYLQYVFKFQYILDPRRLYEQTRDGYGNIYFTIGTFIRIAFFMNLFSSSRRLDKFFFGSVLFLLALITGSKSYPYSLGLYTVSYLLVFNYKNSPPTKMVLSLFGLSIPLAFLLMRLSFGDLGETPTDLLSKVSQITASYVNEGFNNTVLIINTFDTRFDSHFYGDLLLEDNLLTRIPRFLYPDKPYVFGSFRLSYEYFYTSTLANQGYVTFGKFGALFADFGYLGFLFPLVTSSISSCLSGYFLGLIMRINNPNYSFVFFYLLLSISLVSFVSVPPGNNIIEDLLLLSLILIVLPSKRLSFLQNNTIQD
jgi:hypothetical protein